MTSVSPSWVSSSSLLALVVVAAGCLGSQPREVPPEQRFGHRYEDDESGRETIVITPPDSARAYFYYPAPIDTARVRPALFDENVPADSQVVPVEVLVEGAFPDGCTRLHHVEQDRHGHVVDVYLEMRRPQGAVCASVYRPYRFYLLLEGGYGPGHYTLKLNGKPFPFEVRRRTISQNS